MKIAVANTQIPFVKGGAEVLCDGLCRELIRRGHTVEKLLLPLQEFPPGRLMENVLAAKLMEIPQADLLIALKFPAYLIPHPNKRYWIIHQLRQAYDLYGTPFGYRDAPALRAAIARGEQRGRSIPSATWCPGGFGRQTASPPPPFTVPWMSRSPFPWQDTGTMSFIPGGSTPSSANPYWWRPWPIPAPRCGCCWPGGGTAGRKKSGSWR